MMQELAQEAELSMQNQLHIQAFASNCRQMCTLLHQPQTILNLCGACHTTGKQRFKPHLEPFLHPMFSDLTCGHQLTEAAAGKCIAAMRDLLGPSIFAARLLDWQARLLATDPNIPPTAGRMMGPGMMGEPGMGPGFGPLGRMGPMGSLPINPFQPGCGLSKD